MDELTCKIKEYIQPFERQLALQELEALTGVSPVPKDGDDTNALTFSIARTVDADLLRESLTYWRTVADGLTVQLRSEATSLVAMNGAPVKELTKRVSSLVPLKLPKKRCLRYATHGLHEYRGKFFPQLVSALVNVARLPENAIVLDPMCGSGTTLVEALLSAKRCYGLDMNPLSAFVASVKCEALTLRDSDLVEAYDRLLEEIEEQPDAQNTRTAQLSADDRKYLARWFDQTVLAELDCLESAIRRLPARRLRDFYYVCLSNILRSVSWQKNDDLRVRREITDSAPGTTTARFLCEALRSTKTVAAFLAERGPMPAGGHFVRAADARRAAKELPQLLGKVDAVITSPPYATALPYVDTDRLNLIYLGLLPRQDHRGLDMMMIGNREVTTRGRAEYWNSYQANRALLPQQTQLLVERIDRLNRATAVGFRRRNLSALLSKYFFDMRTTLQQAFALLRPGAPMFLVIGNNRTVAGGEPIEIRTADHLSAIAENIGFQPADKLSMDMLASRDIFRKNAMRSEYIVRLDKPQ